MSAPKSDSSKERLQKIIARAGITSRRKAEALIEAGRVAVNGKVAILGTKADPRKDKITIDGETVRSAEKKVYLRMFKPRGYITAVSDDRNRPVVTDLLQDVSQRIYPIGRLDFDTEGLLLLTNDGDLAHALAHPSHQIPRTYHVKVKGQPSPKTLQRLLDGVQLEDGIARALSVERVTTTDGGHAWIELILTEGRNREVRRMCDAIGHRVMRLRRIKYAHIDIEGLRPGESQNLSLETVVDLYRAAGISPKDERLRKTKRFRRK